MTKFLTNLATNYLLGKKFIVMDADTAEKASKARTEALAKAAEIDKDDAVDFLKDNGYVVYKRKK